MKFRRASFWFQKNTLNTEKIHVPKRGDFGFSVFREHIQEIVKPQNPSLTIKKQVKVEK